MNREDFRTLAYGQYLRSHREDTTIDIKEADNFVDGAMFAFDKMSKKEFSLGTFGVKDEPIVEPIYRKVYSDQALFGETTDKRSVLSSSVESV
jgi:hypothetical protein